MEYGCNYKVDIIKKIIKEGNKTIIVVTGPSGAGKTGLTRCLTKERPISEIVSCTSRTPRAENNEIEGIDYYFKSREYILDLIKSGQTVENSNYVDNDLYCISAEEMLNKLTNNDVVVVITDNNGIIHLKTLFGDSVKSIFVFTTPKSLSERLLKRGDKPEKIIQRMTKLAQDNELDNYKYSDFAILNNNFELSKKQLFAIVDEYIKK